MMFSIDSQNNIKINNYTTKISCNNVAYYYKFAMNYFNFTKTKRLNT